MLAKDLKPGNVVVWNAQPVLLESVNVQSPSARGAATLYKYRARNLITKQKLDITLKGTDDLPEADFYKRAIKLMYVDNDFVHFLDQEDFNQYSLPLADCQDQLPYLTEDLDGVLALIFEDQCVGIQLPVAVELTIVQCDPAVRGNSATARTKPAKLQTGLEIQVPEYMKEGERVKVDTRSGEFLSRA